MIISDYNKHKRGIDLMNRLIRRFQINMKTRKRTNQLFHHLIDVSCVNAFILYKRATNDNKMDQASFLSKISEFLCHSQTNDRKFHSQTKSKTLYPVDDSRYDRFDHWCKFLKRSWKKMCKRTGCKSETQAYCTKCELNLCNSSSKDCFIQFHTRRSSNQTEK